MLRKFEEILKLDNQVIMKLKKQIMDNRGYYPLLKGWLGGDETLRMQSFVVGSEAGEAERSERGLFKELINNFMLCNSLYYQPSPHRLASVITELSSWQSHFAPQGLKNE